MGWYIVYWVMLTIMPPEQIIDLSKDPYWEPCNILPAEIVLNSLKYGFFLLVILSIFFISKKKYKFWHVVIYILTFLFLIINIIALKGHSYDFIKYISWWRLGCL